MAQVARKPDDLQLRVLELEEALEAKDLELKSLRNDLARHKLEVEETVTFMVHKITGSSLFSEAATFSNRLQRLEADVQQLKGRLARYASIPFLKSFRKVRAKVLRLPVPEN